MNREARLDALFIPGRLGPAARGGLPAIELRHASGARAELALQGAHVTAWQGADGADRLFLSRCSRFQAGVPIRGGVPVVFPQFGAGPLPQHGLARTRAWRPVRSAVEADGAVVAVLALESDEALLALWPHPFRLELAVALADTLSLSLAVENTGTKPFAFQAALHTYFRVSDIAGARVIGLAGSAFQDFLGKLPGLERREALAFDAETDRLFTGVPDVVRIEDPGARRVLRIEKRGMPDVVVWNPWIDKARCLEDLGDNEYRTMVCVETGAIRPPIGLAPGSRWLGRTVFRALQEGAPG